MDSNFPRKHFSHRIFDRSTTILVAGSNVGYQLSLINGDSAVTMLLNTCRHTKIHSISCNDSETCNIAEETAPISSYLNVTMPEMSNYLPTAATICFHIIFL